LRTETVEQVTRETKRRFDPSLSDPSFLVLRQRRQIFDAGGKRSGRTI
jgi:hypothetical protein